LIAFSPAENDKPGFPLNRVFLITIIHTFFWTASNRLLILSRLSWDCSKNQEGITIRGLQFGVLADQAWLGKIYTGKITLLRHGKEQC